MFPDRRKLKPEWAKHTESSERKRLMLTNMPGVSWSPTCTKYSPASQGDQKEFASRGKTTGAVYTS